MILLACAITQRFFNPTNNRLRTSSNIGNQEIVQGDRVNIQSKNSGNDDRNIRRSYIQEEIIKGNNVQNDAGNIQRTLRTTSSGTTANDEAGVMLTDEQNDFIFTDASRMEEIEELSANICLMARIQPTNIDSDDGPSYDSAFLSENLKLYDASCLDDSKIHMHIRDTEDILDDATKSQIKIKNKMKDPIAIEKKQNICTIDYKRLNALYEDFVPQKELFAEQKYFPTSFIPFENYSNASSPDSSSETKPNIKPMPSANPICQKQNLDFELQLQHEKERRKCESSLKSICETSWISKMEKLEREINELIENVNQKTHDYAVVYGQNQDLLITIYELKAKLKTVEKGKSVNTKFDKANVSNDLLYVTLINKHFLQKKDISPKTEEKHILSKTVTLQTSPKQAVGPNKNVIAPGMYKFDKKQDTTTNRAKSVLSSTGLRATSSVRRPSNRDVSFKNSVLSNTKNSSKKV
ncbi:hypothetical protein Tco_1377062 [Tanacetum coccineum]